MNAILLTIILIPVIEIYLFIEIGGKIGALYTISLIFLTAVVGIYYAKYEGFNTRASNFWSEAIKTICSKGSRDCFSVTSAVE